MRTVEPGIYTDMSNEEYHASAGISKSGISLLLDCPLKYKTRYIDGIAQEPTNAMVIGSATHTAVFEPDKFNMEYAIAPDINRRTKDGKAEYEKFIKSSAGKQVLSRDDATKVFEIAESVRNHTRAGSIVKAADGIAEQSIFVEHPETGFLIKARPDWQIPSLSMNVDLKTTTDASPEAFSRAIYNFGYDIQSGMYNGVSQLAGIDIEDFIFIVVEKTEPYAVAVYMADIEMLDIGRRRFEKGMQIYKQCMESGKWPGVNNDAITSISLPYWATKQIEEALNV